ncbi:MAG: polysaccharide pyruvyl transferase family protein [Synergistaceae bacterium]|nr:polysaccharide pyruvyl transferase family protein [Synergistaceae bacterium]
MKIRILTFHCAKNYGAVTQAYALKTVLKRYTDDVAFINYRPLFITNRAMLEKPNNPSIKYFIIETIRKIVGVIRYHFWGYKEKIQKYVLFEKEYLLDPNQPSFTKKEQINAEGTNYIFLGSDQIWNNKITFEDTAFFGDFSKGPNAKLISYAASIGLDDPGEDTSLFISKNINSIDKISVRESSAEKFIAALTSKRIENVLDPTLLLDTQEWSKLAVLPQYNKYLLFYNMGNRELAECVAKEVAKIKGLEIVEISSGGKSIRKVYSHQYLGNVGPREFIGVIQNADFVVTSSFHGTAFSLIFNKQFYAIPNPPVTSRMEDLLSKISIENRLISSLEELAKRDISKDPIDYSEVNKSLELERQKSINFIENSLGVNNGDE